MLNSGKLTYRQFSGGMSHIDIMLVNSKIVAKCNVSDLNKCLFQYDRYQNLTFLLEFVFVFLNTITSTVFKSQVINKWPLSLYICQLASSTFQRGMSVASLYTGSLNVITVGNGPSPLCYLKHSHYILQYN